MSKLGKKMEMEMEREEEAAEFLGDKMGKYDFLPS